MMKKLFLHKSGTLPLDGQHFELGIAENNLFLALGAAGLSDKMFGCFS